MYVLQNKMNFLTPAASPPISRNAETDEERQALQEDEEIAGAWAAVELEKVQASLEEQANQLADMQEHRLDQRREIADKTKAFKALPEANPQAIDLVKLYQKSLEDVTTQAKFSTNAFLSIFKVLRELPDPASTISSNLQRLSSLRARVRLLEEREENLANALRASREKARGVDELRAEREQFRENVQLDGAAILEAERVAAQEKLVIAQAMFEEELAKVQAQLDLALEELERLKAIEASQTASSNTQVVRSRSNSEEVQVARSEGYSAAEKMFTARLEEASKLSEESSAQYQRQLDELRITVSVQIEQIGELRAELASRPDRTEFEKMQAQLAVMTRLTSENPQEQLEPRITEKLDGLEAWLLNTNQRLVNELNQAKDELKHLRSNLEAQQQRDASGGVSLLLSGPDTQAAPDDEQKTSLVAIKSQRDRLRAVLEKRDLEIERLQNNMDERDQKVRRLEDDAEKLRQRVRFLQSYKVSEKSTLLPSASSTGDPESGTASLGRGVGHEFRVLWEAERKNASAFELARNIFRSARKDRKSMMVLLYMGILHMWLLFALFHGA